MMLGEIIKSCRTLLKKPVASRLMPQEFEIISSDNVFRPTSTPTSGGRCVLVDDDLLIRMGWQSAAEDKGINLDAYATSHELLSSLDKYAKKTVFYIDAQLSNGERGEELAVALHELGYTEIYLATGYDQQFFSKLIWLKGVLGKQPPF